MSLSWDSKSWADRRCGILGTVDTHEYHLERLVKKCLIERGYSEIIDDEGASGNFLGRVPFFKMINIFACTCPNRSGVGAIDNPDWIQQAFVQYCISEDPEIFFMHDISMVRCQKMSIFDVLKTFISKITYYKLY